MYSCMALPLLQHTANYHNNNNINTGLYFNNMQNSNETSGNCFGDVILVSSIYNAPFATLQQLLVCTPI